jgi:hypothetical protein
MHEIRKVGLGAPHPEHKITGLPHISLAGNCCAVLCRVVPRDLCIWRERYSYLTAKRALPSESTIISIEMAGAGGL